MATIKKRSKKRIPEIMPKKKWLSTDESAAWMDMSRSYFLEIAKQHNLTVSTIGSKKYFRAYELDSLIEKSVA